MLQAGGQRLQVLSGISGVTSSAHTPDSDNQGSKKGCLFAILGPSGAGKTTLLDILAGRRRGIGVTGQLMLNGHPVDGRVTRNTVGYTINIFSCVICLLTKYAKCCGLFIIGSAGTCI